MASALTSLVDILRWRARNQPHRLAYRFLKDGELDEVCITYEELDNLARAIGSILQANTRPMDRALLLLPAGLDFIASYFGCLYARVIAIPLPPPHPVRLEISLTTTLRVLADAEPVVAILNSSLLEAMNFQSQVRDLLKGIKMLVTGENSLNDLADQWRQPDTGSHDIAFLQYTSGSTNLPRGVMVSHANLLHNLELIEDSFGQTSDSETVIWLPPYHDMGLIGGILQPLYTGNPVTLIPPMMFLQRPIRWLQAITRYKATTSGGPNFAYDLCLKKIKPEQREQLDLSTWEVAFNGAEPVSQKTLDQFAEFFAPCGFRKEAFLPCYGLAEATLLVSGGPKLRLPVMKNLMKSGLQQNAVIESSERNEESKKLVSSGQIKDMRQVRIVDPETLTQCLPNQIGEIWVSGASIAKGYWNRPVETSATFGARLAGSDEGPFLRTGDLGFQHDGELFITGRIKNLIIIDGKNHHGHDVEKTVENTHPCIQPLGCAVFSIEDSGKEQVVILVEIQHKLIEKKEEVIKAIRKAVSEQHEIPVFDIRLTLPGSIPRTTSGKIRHYLCKQNYLSGNLKEITLS